MNAVDEGYLHTTVELAQRGLCTATPNPRVGCLLVRNGRVIGRGWHVRPGEGHAEVNAIADAARAGESTQGATAYVSLEPCSFFGRTPPCVNALLDAGVVRVVAAAQDPHPKVSGQGFAALRDAGVDVELKVLPSALDTIAGYALRVAEQRPFVRLKAAASMDGRIAMASGESQWITSAEARADVQYWRARSCAILTGSGTVLADNPALTVRDAAYAIDGQIRAPLRVVLDSMLRTDPTATVYIGDGESMVVHSEQADTAAVDTFAAHERIVMPGAQPALDAVLRELAIRDCNEVLVEAGPRLLGAFLHAGLWDELVLYLAPKFLGSSAQPLFAVGLDRMADAFDATIQDVAQIGPDLRLTLKPHPQSGN